MRETLHLLMGLQLLAIELFVAKVVTPSFLLMLILGFGIGVYVMIIYIIKKLGPRG